ncbi:mitofusin [Malassezia sp. CBS 17886]|nr:mitofusin [Malassezia sp. CBS 17886]
MSAVLAKKVDVDTPAKAEEEPVDAVTQPGASAVEMDQDQYVRCRDQLVSAIDDTDGIVRGLREFNQAQWVLRYPASGDSDAQGARLSVLRLELKLDAAGNASTLVDALEKSSVGQLLDERMGRSENHLRSLRVRICDTQSKVLVTGDLNSGKSTFVNALLRRAMVPTDQQPCTLMFCEMHDAGGENGGVEEVHMVYDVKAYDRADPSTYTRRRLDELDGIFAAEEEAPAHPQPVLKCYCTGMRAAEESLLHNGAVDIALIDAPGLNRDSVKTTALFARQEEIDVVVFVVSAENHFTLSACEFLQNASNDKAYVFVVVNKFDQIRDQNRCRRRVLEQIRELSPHTYEEASELVHFVDSRAMCAATGEEKFAVDGTVVELGRFAALENSLHDFVLRRRAKSKLLPAQTYLHRLLGDVVFLSQLNQQAAHADVEDARARLAKSRPLLADCEANAVKVQHQVEGEEDRVVSQMLATSESTVADALAKVGRGESAHASVALPAYPGLFRLWEYAEDVRSAMLASLQAAVHGCEENAREATTAAVHDIGKLSDTYVPKEPEHTQRVFVPEAMFAKRDGPTVALAGLGVSVDIVAVRVSDLFDVHHHLALVTGTGRKPDAKEASDETSLVPSLSLGLGALTLVGTKSLGVKTAIEAFVRVTDILGSRAARRWAAPVLLVVSVGAVAWIAMDLPRAVPRNVGRSIQTELASGRSVRGPGHSRALLRHSTDVFATMHAARVTRETRKVLRLASWDLQEKFRVAVAKRRSDVEKTEAQEKCAALAHQWFAQTVERSTELSHKVDSTFDVTTF